MASLKATAAGVLPQKTQESLRRMKARRRDPLRLFDGDDSMFKSAVAGCEVFGEYGCGASTQWMAANSEAEIFSVDTSGAWAAQVRESTKAAGRVTVKHVDLGPLGEWGRPKSFERRTAFATYADWIWEQERRPSVVLIDGRFRVACLMTALLKADTGTKIIFDDYTKRPHYHVVEEVIVPVETCGRQALFVVPPRDRIDVAAIEELLVGFRHVID